MSVTLQYLLKRMFCYIGMKLSMCLIDVLSQCPSLSIRSIPVKGSATLDISVWGVLVLRKICYQAVGSPVCWEDTQ